MVYYYEFDNEEYDYEPDWEDVKKDIKYILKTKNIDEIFNICQDLEDGDYSVEEYFYNELEELFEDKAREEWENSKNTIEDEKFDYWNAKF